MLIVERALISVSDKTGLDYLVHGLVGHGFEIFSTGGTRKFLLEKKFKVREVAEYTGFPEMMDGRLKTLHPMIHGGILRRDYMPDDLQKMEEHGILPFGIVCVNLYPFEETVARPGVTETEATEKIDIGGPSMVRSAAKNYEHVYVVTSPAQYTRVLTALMASDEIDRRLAAELSCEAFELTARYDAAIAAYKRSKLPT